MDIRKVTNDWNYAAQFLDEKINSAKAVYNPLIAVIANSLDAYGIEINGLKNVLNDNGSYYKVIASVDLGSLAWEFGDETKRIYRTPEIPSIKMPSDGIYTANIKITNDYKPSPYTQVYAATVDKVVSISAVNHRIYVRDTTFTGGSAVADLKASLSGVILYYEMTVPTEETIRLMTQ